MRRAAGIDRSKGARSTVAKQKRNPAKSKPITSNPLFPAVVGLWFGALFGLGSLAVRPSLIEDLVLRSRIDLIVPAAAPPLGVTARILLALLLAAAGTLIGLILARRLARPKIEVKERSRGAREFAATPTRNRARDAHPDAPSCTPVSIHDLGPAMTAAPDTLLAGRRRSLTVDHVEDHFVPHEFAPLPGGELQIANLPSQPVAVADPAPAQQNYDPAAALAPVTLPAAEPARQVFQPEAAVAAPELAADSAAAHADGRQVFGMTQPAPQPEKPRQIFGMAVENDHVPQDFIRDAGYSTTVFETEVPRPLFDRAPVPTIAPLPEAVSTMAPQSFSKAIEPVASPAIEPAVIEAAPVPQAYAPATELIQAVPVAAPAIIATEPPLPNPAGLGMTDLASRLAESMRRRRAARSAAAAGLTEPHTEIPAQIAASLVAPELPAPSFAVAPDVSMAPAPLDLAEHQIAAAPQLPQEFVPSAQAEIAALTSPAAPTQAAAAPVATLPNALRPLALDAFLEEDTEFESTLLPPRRIAMVAAAPAEPAAPAPAAPTIPIEHAVPVATAPIPAAYEPVLDSIDELPEDVVAEENYASLLGIAQPRSGFVRIDEPEADGLAPEPVVIFPGQTPLGQPSFVPSTGTQPAADETSFRRFDSPAAAGHGQPVEMVAAAPAVAAVEADQALRTALASLQRISGAA
jgi:hypothetical protein